MAEAEGRVGDGGRFLAIVAEALLSVSVVDAILPDEDIERVTKEWTDG